jgi:rsbT co-antagonist protein RsbR
MTASLQDDPVDPTALARVREAILLAADGNFAAAARLLEPPSPGALGELERAARALISDYRALVAQHSFSIEEFSASKRELLMRLDTIKEQQAAIQTLSAPIIDIWDDILMAPLTGELDPACAQDLATRLLARLGRSRVAWVILDLTGAEQIDATLAGHLVQLARAVRLMGAECLLTGLGPQAAQTLVTLAIPLEGLRSLASLKDGLKFCLARTRGPSRAPNVQ